MGCEPSTLASGNDPATSGPDTSTPNPVAWQTQTVALSASNFWILADGERFNGTAGIDVHSDPGSGTYTTLELTWSENSREMRFFIYFSADASGWQSNEMRTYDGQPSPADWLYYRGAYFASPIGVPFHGDLDLTNAADDPYPGELHLRGLVLSTALTGS
jgi:hypothetical protein